MAAIASILTGTKKNLGIAEDDESFDHDVLTHINSVFSTLNQLGIGPQDGYMIEDKDPTWDEFIGDDPRLNQVKSYMYLRVRLLFDPPATSYLIASLDDQVRQMEWRMNVYREETEWVDPDPAPV